MRIFYRTENGMYCQQEKETVHTTSVQADLNVISHYEMTAKLLSVHLAKHNVQWS